MNSRAGEMVIVAATVAASALAAFPAQAATCQDSHSHQCWASLSGPNYSQVVVGYPYQGSGIACAVQSPQLDNWGSRVDCYAPLGTSGAYIIGRTGDYLASSPFVGSDGSKRIVSLAVSNGGATLPSSVTLWALRSDGAVFSATTNWPRDPNGDPTFPFVQDSFTPPPSLRSIAWANPSGLFGVTANNQLFLRTSTGWGVVQGVGSVALLAGAPSGGGFTLPGVDASSTVLGRLGVIAPPKPPMPHLPQPLTRANPNTTNPNMAFTFADVGFGQATPLALAGNRGWALVPGRCPSGNTPCILSSTFNNLWGWSAWQGYATGDLGDPGTPAAMPWTIQDGGVFRRALGEVWVIWGPERLSFWVPPSTISVVSATYGGNCGAQSGNVTGALAAACNGLGQCNYTIDWQVLGDPAYGCAKTYEAQYTCTGDPTVRSVSAPAEAGFGSVVGLSCP